MIKHEHEHEHNCIDLHRDAQGWKATYRGLHAERVRALFGTDTLLTAFTVRAAASTVKAAIEALNPGVEVLTR